MKEKRYIYSFYSGGWNTEIATTKRQAISLANKRWAGTAWSDINEQSFEVISDRDYNVLLID
jgi:hypothetical protein